MKGWLFLFTKYKLSDGNNRVLLLFLILGGYDINKIVRYEETLEEHNFGLKIKKFYGITPEYVDTDSIEKEIENIQCPTICSEQSFEYYADSKKLYEYRARFSERPLYINDMGIISKAMMITDEYIVTSNKATADADLLQEQSGFMYFAEYVKRSSVKVGKWDISYKDNVLNVIYTSPDEKGKEHSELVYSIIEVDKTSTYKLVVYIIRKTVSQFEEMPPDNFIEREYTLIR